MSLYALRFIQQLRRKREVKLTPNAWRILDYLGDCANEDAAKSNSGQYFAFPSEEEALAALAIGRGTWYRGLDKLEYNCGFYIITRRDRKDRRATIFDLHIQPEELTPEAVEKRRQVAEARQSQARDIKGVRKRNVSPIGPSLPKITSQIGTYSETDYVPKWDVITSQNETEPPKITSQIETYNQNVCGTNQNLEPEGKETARSKPSVSRTRARDSETRASERPPLSPGALAKIWGRVEQVLRRNIEPDTFTRYFSGWKLAAVDFKYFTIEVPPHTLKRYSAEVLEERVAAAATEANMLRDREVRIVTPKAKAFAARAGP